MNRTDQPFTEHVTRANVSKTAKMGWVIALIIALLVAVSVWLWSSTKNNRQKIESFRADLEEKSASLTQARAEHQTNQDQIATLESKLAELEKERELITKKAKGLEDEMRADLESKDVTISKLQGKLTVNILDRIMFDSGEAVLKPGGEAVMEKIATLLSDHPELKSTSSGIRITSRFALQRTAGLPVIGNFPPHGHWRRYIFLPKRQALILTELGRSVTGNIGRSQTIQLRRGGPKTGASPSLFFRTN